MNAYRNLDGTKVAATVSSLRERIESRFGADRGLARVASELHTLVTEVDAATDESASNVRRTRRAGRTASAALVLVVSVAIVTAVLELLAGVPREPLAWLAVLESGINNLVYAFIAVIFLWLLPERLERRTLLRQLHQLRSMAHVVDMHQMRQQIPAEGARVVPDKELRDYFDFSTKLLTLVSKTAALCAEHSSDPVVLDTVQSIETLTTDMSVKIWQKVQLLSLS